MEDENLQLRKRTGRVRERSVEPSIRRKQVDDRLWEQFKDHVIKQFPAIKFPDEYIDEHIVTASVAGVDDVLEFAKAIKGKATLNTQDGRIVLEYDIEKQRQKVRHINMVVSTRFWVFISWLMSFIFTVRFIILNLEKYKKLL